MELVAPTLRADFQLCETYAWSKEPPLDIPFTVFGGREDPNVEPHELEAWRDVTGAAVRVEMLPGDHYYLQHSQEPLVRMVVNDLSSPSCAIS
jgi:medium-chain acyl-[acyl-carrier-protein] hydrolase